MRRWRPFSVVLALLAGCSPTPSDEPPSWEEEASTSSQEVSSWAPCGRTAVALKDIAPGAASSEPEDLVHGDRLLLFTADDGAGRELWKSSGTQGKGTALVKYIPSGPTGMAPSELVRVGDRIFFAAEDPEHGRELWVSDGTFKGTHLVKDIWPGETGSFPRSLFEFKGLLYFAAGDPDHGRELWRSDGTPAGTFLVEDLEPGPEGTSPYSLTRGGDGSLYFLIASQELFLKLMRSDGGPGAVELRRVPASGGMIEKLTPVGKRLFFVTGAAHDDAMFDLEVTDRGRPPVSLGSFLEVGNLAEMGGRLFFSAEDESSGGELWRSDGTAMGTVRVKDIRPGSEGSSPSHLTVVGRRLFFSADDGASGRELWVSNGSASGTTLFADLERGGAGSSPEELTAIEGHLFFSAETAGHGREPWVTDGTRSGTVALEELSAGPSSSNPGSFVRSGWDVFFAAEDDTHGRELWALPFQPWGRCDRDR
ncbi:ELWxxDGT repeat protein [Vitiosangium sp. GDMCC 1.1324]|uniref:ELWxxDGT repeat protein n=1 Tax=Vitiosangium sp. (strain GDMCC 1.1324) TaxID=2138576 RepID=UPI000D3414EE|nr:ELWxxDGT repeat protein [Vitiosangium sp. GDMCC 1.1324]PTL80395.1 hypothetical protein DAT35_27510 [Vitiosangium sp. GDMCC 1.1324]